MPMLDLSFVSLSPMFSDTFDVIRRSMVLVNGRGKMQATRFRGIIGTVVSDSNNQDREGDYTAADRQIQVATPFLIQNVVAGNEPDLIVWHGENFSVESVEDGSAFGAGWVLVTAMAVDLEDQPAGARNAAA